MPPIIILSIALVICSFVADQLSALFDDRWHDAGFSLTDPTHISISIFWLAVIVWMIIEIVRGSSHVPQTFVYLSIICAIFIAIDIPEYSADILVSFQSLELLIWVSLIFISRTDSARAWYKPPEETAT